MLYQMILMCENLILRIILNDLWLDLFFLIKVWREIFLPICISLPLKEMGYKFVALKIMTNIFIIWTSQFEKKLRTDIQVSFWVTSTNIKEYYL